MKIRISLAALAVVAALAAPLPVLAQSLNDGIAAYEAEDYAAAYDIFNRHALEGLEGDIEALYHLGIMHHEGHGAERNDFVALNFLETAALGGHAEAQYTLGGMYRWGQGVAQDYAEAARWYALAAEQGHLGAKNNLFIVEAVIRTAPASAPDLEDEIEFGDDSSRYANDGECQDPLFVDVDLGITLGIPGHEHADATDCRAAYEAGSLRYQP